MRIALTLDDGPNTETTPQVLDILQEHGIVASFFLIADSITPESAKVARRAFDMGCDIENHSRTHSFMNQMTPEEIRRRSGTARSGSRRSPAGRPPFSGRPISPLTEPSLTMWT